MFILLFFQITATFLYHSNIFYTKNLKVGANIHSAFEYFYAKSWIHGEYFSTTSKIMIGLVKRRKYSLYNTVYYKYIIYTL